jgi:hypothetical protein
MTLVIQTVLPYDKVGVVAFVYWPENAFSRTLVLEGQCYTPILIELQFSCHTAPLNVLMLNHTLEVCDAFIWQPTVCHGGRICIDKHFISWGINARYHSGCNVSGIVVLRLLLLARSGMSAIWNEDRVAVVRRIRDDKWLPRLGVFVGVFRREVVALAERISADALERGTAAFAGQRETHVAILGIDRAVDDVFFARWTFPFLAVQLQA